MSQKSWLDSYLSLENLPDHPIKQAYLVYTYIAPDKNSTDRDKFLFIPIRVTANQMEAEHLCRKLVDECREVFYHPMDRWMCLGDTKDEKIEIIDELTQIDRHKKKKAREERQKREKIEKDIREEEKAQEDPDTIESYYYDWICAVQNKIYLESIQKQAKEIEEAYQKRLKNIREKDERNPSYSREWMEVFRERLKNRDEEYQADIIIEKAKVIQEELSHKSQ